ncbi:MAG TPA: polysaccharide deacetylase family protein [Bacilli bacterium]
MPLKKLAVYTLGTIFLVWLFAQIGSVNAFIKTVKMLAYREQGELLRYGGASGTAPITKKQKEELYNRIEQAAKAHRQAPINAKIDRVWKAIPGLNGREVDVEKTYKLALDRGETEPISFVYREIPPRISLDDLPPNPIYRGNPHKPMVALMVNVAWGNEYIAPLLRTLADANVRATFFLDGTWLSKNERTAREMLRQGHELSNHGYSHKNMSKLAAAQAEYEIVRTEQLLSGLGVKNALFAPPSGDFSAETVQLAAKHGLKTILWTLDTVDWKNPAPETIIRKITRGLEPGSLILLHPTAASAKALPELIQNIKNKGLVIGTVSDLISPRRVPEVEAPIDF